MGNLFTLLVVLFAAVALMVFVLERFAKPMSDEQTANVSRWILPLLLVLVLLSMFRVFTGG